MDYGTESGKGTYIPDNVYDLKNTSEVDIIKGEVHEAAIRIVSTFGPKGQTVVIRTGPGEAAFVTSDGVTVAQALKHTSLGATLLVDAAERVVSKAGDGTTSVCLLIHLLLANGLDMSEDVDEMVHFVEGSLVKEASDEDVILVAKTATKDESLGQKLGELILKLGPDGFVKGIIGTKFDMYIREGYEFPSGVPNKNQLAVDFHFLTRHRGSVTMSEPLVIIVEHALTKKEQVIPILEGYVAETDGMCDRPLIFVYSKMEEPVVLFTLKQFFNRTPAVPVYLVQAPFPDKPSDRYEVLQDLAYVCKCPFIYSKIGKKMIRHDGRGFQGGFGQVDMVEVTPHSSRFIAKRNLDKRIEEVKGDTLPEELSEFQKLRISYLSGSVGVVEYAPNTLLEHGNLQLRLEDGLLAAQGAMRDGCVEGGQALWLALADQFPQYRVVFENIAGRLPETKALDSAAVTKQVLLTASSLVHQLNTSHYVIDNAERLGNGQGHARVRNVQAPS